MTLVLVGTDFSTRSDRALWRAAMLAKAAGWSIHLLAVIDDDQPPAMVDAHVREAGSILDDLAATMERHDGVACRTEVRTGDPFMTLADAAREIMPTVMVLGPHRRQLLRDQFLGTTVERTLRRTTCPVIVANGVSSGAYRRVMIAVDLEPYSEAGLRTADALPFVRGAKRMAMYAYDPIADAMLAGSFTPVEERAAYREETMAAALGGLENFLLNTGVRGFAPIVRPSRGEISVAITEASRALDVDLIVLTASDKNALTKKILGSTVEAVLRDAEVDVLVIHPGR